MNTKTDWIKMTDRRPTKADFPVWAWTGINGPILYTVEPPSHMTHWRPAKDDIPEPPKAEPTLKERDHDAYVQWLNDRTSSEDSAWHAALAYERAEVAKMLPPERSDLSNWDTVAHAAYASTKAIRARCAGGGK
jgi:hypothetical protein